MKPWYTSKTIWVNFLAMLAMFVQLGTGKEILTPDVQIALLTVVNVIIRIVTKEEITW